MCHLGLTLPALLRPLRWSFSLTGRKQMGQTSREVPEDGQSPPAGSPGFPDGIVVASRDAWRNRFYKDAWAKEPQATEDTLSKRFRRAVSQLLDGNQICSIGEWFWLDSRTKPDMSGH